MCKVTTSKNTIPPYNWSDNDYNNIDNISEADSSSNHSPQCVRDPDYVEGDFGKEIIFLVKEQVRRASNFADKIYWLTLTPVSWSITRL